LQKKLLLGFQDVFIVFKPVLPFYLCNQGIHFFSDNSRSIPQKANCIQILLRTYKWYQEYRSELYRYLAIWVFDKSYL